MMVICNRAGKTLSCKTCCHGKPHEEEYNLPEGAKVLFRVCFERNPPHQTKCIPAR